MFLSRKGLWFPLCVILVYASIGSVWSTKQDDDTIGNAFGSLFKAILNVVKSQFEATKDFVPGLDTAGGETSTNDTDQNAGVNGTKGKDNNDVKQVDMKVGMTSKNVFVNDKSFVQGSTSSPSIHEDVSSTTEAEDHRTFTEGSIESTIHRPGLQNQDQSVSETGDEDQAFVPAHLSQSVSEELNPDQASSQKTGDQMANQADTTVQMTADEHQSTYTEEAVGNSKLPGVSFSSAEALSQEQSLPGMSGVQGADAWPFQPDVKEMLGVLEQEIIEPVDNLNSKSNDGDEELDKAGYVHANNMTEVEVSTTIETSAQSQSQSLTDDTAQNPSNVDVQYQSQETERKMPNHDGTEDGLSETFSNSIENPETNDSNTTGLILDDNLASSDGFQKVGGNNGEKSLSDSLQGLPVTKEDGGDIWPFQQDIGGMVHTLEKELDQYGMSPPEKPGQGHDNFGEEELNNDKKVEQSNIKIKDGNTPAGNVETHLSNEESVDQEKSQSPGGPKDTKGSDESNTLLRLVNTL
ncbi:uncharacterized protein LOC110441682 [Mizuhopecten yessoensis]|uniref:Uncharacterized protein n=1 Tax=Mizuhopecten yessoensis TaxID=6573 RepID=A0A210PIW6_MIZYE|nr:uncharacterized protein LOC110441682 [Mizuhopecten yessoensis]OWF36437.1 hypothetical protein KP79_PYT03193 [Mizuhopecten yessoensis]